MAREVLAEVSEPDNLVEELAAGRELQDDEVMLLRLGELDQPDDVGVIELAHDLDFFEDVRSLDSVMSVPSSSEYDHAVGRPHQPSPHQPSPSRLIRKKRHCASSLT